MNYQQRKQAIYAEYARSYDADREKFTCAEGFERRVHFFCEALRNGDTVVDLGCGTGAFLKAIAQRTPKGKVFGLDISTDMLERAQQRLNGTTNVELKQADLSGRFPLADASFDVVVASNINYELPDQEQFLKEVCRILKPYPAERETPQLVAGLLCLRDNSPVNQEYARIAGEKLLWNLLTCDEIIELVHDVGLHIVGHRPIFIENRKFNQAIAKKQVIFSGYYRVSDELVRSGYDPASVSLGHIWLQAIKPKTGN